MRVTVLCGGVGAARFLTGLVRAVDPADVTAVVNTGDDTVLHGLAISPDLDTIVYTLADAIDPERGWGLAGETWRTIESLERYEAVRPAGSAAATRWFSLGDRDLATHLYRTARLAEGAPLTDVTAEIARAWGLNLTVLPASDEPVRTVLTRADTGEELSFQDYFVRLRHAVPIAAIDIRAEGGPTTQVRAALEQADVIVIAPSNPLVSVAPIRTLAGIDDLLIRRRDQVVAVSPIVGGSALKGPAERLMRELGLEPSVAGVARIYAPVASALVVDSIDAELASAVEAADMTCVVTETVMRTPEIATDLARACLGAVPH